MIIYKLKDIPKNLYDMVGGKSRGLRELIGIGLNVPDGFIIADMNREEDYAFALDYYARSGLGSVAVRLSASGIDGEDCSLADQYEAMLGISDKRKLQIVIKKSDKLLKKYMTENYCDYFEKKGNAISIIVQSMVDVKFAGVCFSKNPIDGKSEIVVEAVRGLSNSLVTGKSSSKRYTMHYTEDNRRIVDIQPPTSDTSARLLTNQQLSDITKDLAKAVEKFGCPLSMEWAIDKAGDIYWLQVLPITTLANATLDEFDPSNFDSDTVFIKTDLEGLLPKTSTPLSLSTTVYGVDSALRTVMMKAGIGKGFKRLPPYSFINAFSNNLFLNLSNVNKIACSLLAIKKEDIETSISGSAITDKQSEKKQKLPIRVKNFLVFIQFIMSRKKAIRKLDALAENLTIASSENLSEFYKNILSKIECLSQAALLHYMTTTHYLFMTNRLKGIVKSAYQNESETKNIMSSLMKNIEGIENNNFIESIDKIAKETVRKYSAAADFSLETLAEFVKNDELNIKEAYDSFIFRHGHRSFRDVELKNKSFQDDEYSLMEMISAAIKNNTYELLSSQPNLELVTNELLKTKKRMPSFVIKFYIKQARKGEFSREYTKSKYIKVVEIFKKAYRELAAIMVKRRIIKEEDLVYFFTNGELTKLLIEKDPTLVKRAIQRKKLFDRQSEISFEAINFGKPKPIRTEPATKESNVTMSGTSISNGDVRGRARVVHTLDDANQLKPGEIMVAQFANSTFLPFYDTISGLVIEVGSAISHGAVSAREYNIPLVVNVENATIKIQTGDYIRLNANKGVVTILEKAEKQD